MRKSFNVLAGLGMLSLALQAFTSQKFLYASSKAPNAPMTVEDRLRVFSSLWTEVNERFYDPGFNGVDWAQMKVKYRPRVESVKTRIQLQTLLQTMLDELHSSHVDVFFDTDKNVGVGFNSRRGPIQNPVFIERQWVVRSVEEGSGASQVGVQRGWILTNWNEEPYGSETSTECDTGETIKLRFLDLQSQVKILDVPCGTYPYFQRTEERSARIVDGAFLYVRLPSFEDDIGRWLTDQAEKNSNVDAIVVDLRRNGGGDIDVVQNCLSPFFSEPEVFGEFHHRNGTTLTVKVSGRGKRAYLGRVFVLVDDASGSGSEVFAAGMQESGRGIIVGRQTMGAVLNAKRRQLGNGFYSVVAHSDFKTTNGIRLEGRGVSPEYPVTATIKDFREKRDLDLDRVRELLNTSSATQSK
jgi:carboxyl-terminal processing protease